MAARRNPTKVLCSAAATRNAVISFSLAVNFVFRLRRIECGAPHTFDPVSAVLVQQPKLGTVRQPHTIFGEKTLLQPIEQVQFTRTYCTGQTPEAHC